MPTVLRHFAVIWVLAYMVLGGCSPQEQGEPQPPSTDPVPLSLQLQWVTQCQFAGYYVALQKGWYREEGIDLTIKPGGPDLVPVDLVAARTSDFGTTLLADLSVAIQKGQPVISIGQIQQTNGLLLIAKKSSGIDRPERFSGKRVGVWLGSWEAQFNALLARANQSEKDVRVISQGWSMDPFLKGELDVASVMVYNEYHVVLENGIPAEDLLVIDYADYGLAFPGDVLFTSHRLINENPDRCLRMLRASLRGWQYALDHPQEAVDIVLKYDESGIQTKAHQLSMMAEISRLVRHTDRPLGYSDPEATRQMLDTLLKYQIIATPLTPDQVIDTKCYDRIHREATKG